MVKVPTFNFSTTLNRDVKLTDYRGMNIVLVFHPKDNTGCIQEVSDFQVDRSSTDQNSIHSTSS